MNPPSSPSSSSNVQSTWSRIKNLRRSDSLQPPLSSIFRIGLGSLPDTNNGDVVNGSTTGQILPEMNDKVVIKPATNPFVENHLNNTAVVHSDPLSVPGSPAKSSSERSETNTSQRNNTDEDSDTDEQTSEIDQEIIRQIRVRSTDSIASDIAESVKSDPGYIRNASQECIPESQYENQKALLLSSSSSSNNETENQSHSGQVPENISDSLHARDTTSEAARITIVQPNNSNVASGTSVATSSSTTNVVNDEVENCIDIGDSPSSETKQKEEDEPPFSIRLTPFVDHSSFVPSQYISVMERKLKEGGIIKVGRYSDRREADERASCDNQPIVFKSKVVSRSHAEIFVKDGVWCVKDVRSSSGTFLNHVRLSPACQPSTAHPLNDGDFLQLGMDFRGGSEELYKCIKVRVELNKSWRKKANDFNVQALSSLRTAYQQSDGHNLQECAICLLPVSPCQALFVAPCSHAWHYKCVRPLVVKTYPHFMCPNCRSLCDLEADVEEISESDDN